MHNAEGTVWELPFEQPAVLELLAEFGNLALLPVEAGQSPYLELSRGTADNVDVHIEKVGEVVRVVPNHVCVVVNMVDRLIAVRGDRIVGVLPVAARGRLA